VKKDLEKPVSGTASSSTDSPPPPMRLKYEMCKNWRTKGSCPYGDKCLFAHGEAELSRRTTAPPAPPSPTVEENKV
jgi:hypothetical protein